MTITRRRSAGALDSAAASAQYAASVGRAARAHAINTPHTRFVSLPEHAMVRVLHTGPRNESKADVKLKHAAKMKKK